MKGSIRAVVGFLCVFGAVGGMEHGPSDSILLQVAIAIIGLGILYSGVDAISKEQQ